MHENRSGKSGEQLWEERPERASVSNPLRDIEPGYLDVKQALLEASVQITSGRQALTAEGWSEEEIERGLQPVTVLQDRLRDQVSWYERSFNGEFEPVTSLGLLGRSLIAVRLARGMTQRELAMLLNVSEAQVSRDERNEYHGITVTRAADIATSLEASIQIHVEPLGLGKSDQLATLPRTGNTA